MTPNVPSKYKSLLDSNPYANFDYKQSWWQKFLGNLGFRTNYDAYKESMSLQAKEYDAEVMNKAFNEQYETPLEEVSRMRQAGLNPDLQGIGDVAGASAPDIGDENPPVSPESDEAQVVQFANVVMSAVTTAFGLGKDFQSLKNMGIVNRSGEISNGEKVAAFADWIASTYNLSPEQRNTPVYDAKTGEEISPIYAHAADLYDQYSRFIPRRYRKQFARNVASGVGSFKQQVESYDKGSKFLDDKMTYNIMRGRKAFKYGTSDDSIMAVVSHLSELADKVQQSRAQFEANKADFDAQLYDSENGLDPSIEASSRNQVNLESGQSARIQREIDSCMKDIVHDLKISADKGDFFSKMLLLTFSLQRMTGAPGALLKTATGLLH